MKRMTKGFTLIELMIVLIIVGILAAISIPAYTNHVRESRLRNATTTLANTRLQMERYYQDNRAYGQGTGTTCGIAMPSDPYFNFTCVTNATNQGFTIEATGRSDFGLDSFGFRIDQDNATTTFDPP